MNCSTKERLLMCEGCGIFTSDDDGDADNDCSRDSTIDDKSEKDCGEVSVIARIQRHQTWHQWCQQWEIGESICLLWLTPGLLRWRNTILSVSHFDGDRLVCIVVDPVFRSLVSRSASFFKVILFIVPVLHDHKGKIIKRTSLVVTVRYGTR